MNTLEYMGFEMIAAPFDESFLLVVCNFLIYSYIAI